MHTTSILLTILACASALAAHAADTPQVAPLYTGAPPLAKGSAPEDIPSVTIYRPDRAKAIDAAVVVCPGGGYGGLAGHEGQPVAEWLNTLGITGVVLKYRLGPRYHHPVMLNDAGRAIRYVRAHAREWSIDPAKIGILGFSAGGHLASTAATHFDSGQPNSSDSIERVSSRPDFAVLIYPVIALSGPYAHIGSRNNLLGENPDPQLVESLSNQTQITDRTPPVFLVHGADDDGVPVQNSLMFADAMRQKHRPVELHVYAHGAHGFGMGSADPALRTWPQLCAIWMRTVAFVQPGAAGK